MSSRYEQLPLGAYLADLRTCGTPCSSCHNVVRRLAGGVEVRDARIAELERMLSDERARLDAEGRRSEAYEARIAELEEALDYSQQKTDESRVRIAELEAKVRSLSAYREEVEGLPPGTLSREIPSYHE